MVRVDLHVHTSASFDCQVEPWRVLGRCERLGLRPVFVTDHDTIAGAEDLRARRPSRLRLWAEARLHDLRRHP